MRRVLLAIGVIVVLVIVGLVLSANRNSPSPSPSVQPSASSQASNQATSQSPAQSAATITYDSSGFHPDSTTVKSGDSVTFVNKSSETVQVDSNPHPVHTDDTDLNVGAIPAGQSVTVTLTKKGTFGIHNHLDPTEMTKITIQ